MEETQAVEAEARPLGADALMVMGEPSNPTVVDEIKARSEGLSAK
jgi:hypothetical protein